MNAVVFDASVIVKLVADEPGYEAALATYDSVDACVVPDWAFLESAHAVWKKLRRGEITLERSAELIEAAARLDLVPLTSSDIVVPAFNLAAWLMHPVYDCLYLALAIREGVPLVTADAKLRDVALAAGVEVVWIAAS